jgi:hypothetical protein
VPLTTRHQKYAERNGAGPRGFRTPSRKIELYSEALAEHGYPPLPEFDEPAISPRSRPERAERFPLILTCAKSLWFCETQHRNIASLRSRVPDPLVELHPDTAGSRGIAAGDWVRLETPHGSIRARARFNASLDPQVVVGQHGWWQACSELGLPGYPPFGPGSANLNLVPRQQPSDPISGSSPLRASVCEIAPSGGDEASRGDASIVERASLPDRDGQLLGDGSMPPPEFALLCLTHRRAGGSVSRARGRPAGRDRPHTGVGRAHRALSRLNEFGSWPGVN